MDGGKPCAIPDCSAKRLYNLKHCYRHYREFLKKKKEEKKLKKKLRETKTKKYQTGQLKIWHKKTWKLVSELVRRSAADWRGMATCYTCLVIIPWRDGHCSHRHHGKLDFDLRNLKFCCVKCNTYLHGNLGEYERRLIQENGLEWADQLKRDAAQHKGYNLAEVMAIYYDLKEKLAKL